MPETATQADLVNYARSKGYDYSGPEGHARFRKTPDGGQWVVNISISKNTSIALLRTRTMEALVPHQVVKIMVLEDQSHQSHTRPTLMRVKTMIRLLPKHLRNMGGQDHLPEARRVDHQGAHELQALPEAVTMDRCMALQEEFQAMSLQEVVTVAVGSGGGGEERSWFAQIISVVATIALILTAFTAAGILLRIAQAALRVGVTYALTVTGACRAYSRGVGRGRIYRI